MKCNPTNTDIRQALENRKAYHPVSANQSAEDSIAFLDSDNQNFIKDNGKYAFEDFKLRSTVTSDIIKDKVDKINPATKVGTFIHDSIEVFSKEILSSIDGMSCKSAITKLKGLKKASVLSGDFKPDIESEANLFNIARNQILFAYEEQNVINNKTGQNAVPYIKFEAKVIDPVLSKGGTIDFLAVLSDNTFIIREYVSKVRQDKHYDTSGKLINDPFYYKDVDRLKLQISDYASILRKYYGFAGTRSNRIIPVTVNTRLDKTGNYRQELKAIRTYEQDPKLSDIVPFSERTGFESLDKYVESIDKQLADLEVRKNKDIKDRDKIVERINKLTELKKEVLIKKSVNNTLDHAKHLVSQLEKMDELSNEDLYEILQEFRMLQQLSGATYDLRKYLKSEGKETAEMEAKIGMTVSVVEDAIEDLKFEIFNRRVNNMVQDETGESLVNQSGEFIPFSPEGPFAKYFYQLSQFDNPILKALRSKLDKANYEVRENVNNLTQQVIELENAVYQKLASSNLKWSDFVKLMINPKTDNFYAKTSGEFLERMKTLDGIQIPEYYEPQQWYNWKDKQAAYQKQLEIEMKDGTLSGEGFLAKMSEWDRNHSLELSDGKPLHGQAWLNAKESGRLKLIESKIEISDEYKLISATPEYKAYYDFIQEQNEKFRNMLGVEYTKLPNNFLPNIRKSASERIDEMGFLQGSKSSINDFLNNFSIREDDRTDEQTYLKRNGIPKFFMNPFRDKDGKLMQGEKSYQFGRSLLLFAKMAYNYQEMSNIEADVMLLRETLIEKGQELIQKENGIKVNFLGNNRTLPLKGMGIADIFDSFTNMYLYGIHVKPVLFDKSGATEKALLQMKSYFTLKTLGLSLVPAIGSFVAAKIYARLTGKTGIHYNEKQYNKAVVSAGRNRKTFLAMSAFFDPMGHRHGNIRLTEKELGEVQLGDMSQKGWVNQYISTRMLMQPYALGDQNIEEVITYALSQNYYVDLNGTLRKMKFEEDYETYKDRTIEKLFSYENGEAKLNLPKEQLRDVIIAFRGAIQTVQSSIKGTIPEEDKAVWQNQIMGQILMNFKSWMPAIVNERLGKVRYNSRIDSLYMGRYTAIAQEFGTRKTNITGEALNLREFARQIVLPKVGQIIGHLLSFHTVGGYFKGYKVKDDGTKQLMYEKFLNENPQYVGKVTYAEFLDIQQKQLKAAIIEARMCLTLMLLACLAMQDWDDDGEKDYKQYIVTRKLVSILLKTNQELSFMLNPKEFANLTKSPIPMIGLLSDAVNTVTNTFDELLDITFGEERILGGQKKDSKNVGAYSVGWIPGTNGLIRFFDLLTDNVQYENTNR